jgi:hypothetical protein
MDEIVLCLQLNIMLPPPVPGRRAIPDSVEKKLRQAFFSSSEATCSMLIFLSLFMQRILLFYHYLSEVRQCGSIVVKAKEKFVFHRVDKTF